MYAKIKGDTVVKFPYTFNDLRKDNPNVSFPKKLTTETMAKFGMVGVLEGAIPSTSAYQTVQREALPIRPIIKGAKADYWMIHYKSVDMFASTTENGVTTTKAEHESEYQKTLNAEMAKKQRSKRNLLLSDSDWTQVADAPVTASTWATYRKALRDLPSHANWPNLKDADWPTKP